MADTYKAVEASAPGTLRMVERPISEPGAGQVRLRVEACGVCHTDTFTVEGLYPGLSLPRVPGHEVIGRVEALGQEVSGWRIGQRVGVGLFGGQDGKCVPCLRGDFVNCQNLITTGVTNDGGYAEVMIAEARALASIPEEITAADAAPLLCMVNTQPMVLPSEPFDRIVVSHQGQLTVLEELDQLQGLVRVADAGADLRLVRLRTSPATWFAWPGTRRLTEVVEEGHESDLPTHPLFAKCAIGLPPKR
jgi:hypothetical protein